MPTLKDYENTDELHNPSTEQARRLNDLEEKTGQDAGIDQAEAFANDPANASKNIDDTLDREQTASAQASNPFGYQNKGGNPRSKKLFAKMVLKRGGPLGLAALVFGGAGLGLFFLSPGLLLVQMKEVFTNYGSDASRAAPVRYKKLMNYTLGNKKVDAACAKSATGVKCKLGTFSEKQVKAYEDAGFKVRGDDFNGRTRITEIQFPDEQDGKGGTKPGKVVKTGAEYDREIKRSASSASKALRAFNPGNNVFNGARFTSKVLGKWGQNKSKVTLTGDKEEDKKKDFGKKVGADKDRVTLQEDFESKHEAKIRGAVSTGPTSRLAGNAAIGCAVYNLSRATLASAKVYNAARYVTFAMLFLKVADQIKSQGDVDPGTVAALGAILTGYATDGPEKGLSATDSQGYKVAAYGGESKLASFTQKVLLGGNSSMIKLDNWIKAMQNAVGKKNIRLACGVASDPATAIAMSAAVCGAEIGAGNVAGILSCGVGQIAWMAAAGEVVNKIIGFMMPLAIDALVDAPIKTNISGVDAGNSIALGAGTLMDTTNASRGLAPGSKDQVTHFLASTQSSQDEYDRIASYDAQSEPFNMYNEHSFMGSLVRKSGILSLSSASLGGSLTGLGGIFQTLVTTPSTAAAASMPVSLKPGDLDNCPSEELIEVGFACNVMGQPKYMMTDQELNMDVDDNLDYMTNPSNPQVDEESGEPIPESNYDKWTRYCTEQREDLMGSSSLPIEDDDYDWSTGRNCGPLADFSSNSQTDIANYVVYYNTLADKEDQDTETSSSMTTTSSGGAQFRAASFNVYGASHCEGAADKCNAEYKKRMDLSVGVIDSNNINVIGFQEFEGSQQSYFKSKEPSYELYPDSGDVSPNAIAWNTAKFSKVDAGMMPNLQYFGSNKLEAPWVLLQDNKTGQQVYFLNTHDPAHPENAEKRYNNAKQHAVFINSIKSKGIPIVFTGDFNGRPTVTNVGGNVTYKSDPNNLAYCILKRDADMTDAYDIAHNVSFKCPNPAANQRPDHIYLSSGVQVMKYFEAEGGKGNNGSDVHNTQIADLVIPGNGAGSGDFAIASYNIRNIHQGAPENENIRTQAPYYNKIVDNIKNKYKFDIVGTQEMESSIEYNFFKNALSDTYGFFPDTDAGASKFSALARTIIYRKDRFEFVKSDTVTFPREGHTATAPIVWLKDKSSGQVIIFMNTHNSADVSGMNNADERHKAAEIYATKIKQLTAEGLPIFLTGDFNEGYGVRTSGNKTLGGDYHNLFYCMITSNKTLHSLADAGSGGCPRSGIGGVDFIYATPEVKTLSFNVIEGGLRNQSGSDHPAPYAHVEILGSTSSSSRGSKSSL